MTSREQMERENLHHKWATRKLTKKEVDRCMELDRKAIREAKAKKAVETV